MLGVRLNPFGAMFFVDVAIGDSKRDEFITFSP